MTGMIDRVATGLAGPEGPCVLPDGTVYVCESERAVSWHRPNGDHGDLIAGIAPNGAAFSPDGSLYVAEWRQRAILRCTADGTAETLFDAWDNAPLHGPNDLCFLPDGSFYFTDPAREGNTLDEIVQNPNGRVFYVNSRGDLMLVAEGLSFSNGLHWTRDRTRLLVCESGKHRIVAYSIEPNGMLGNPTVFAEDLPGLPDGMCMDVAGLVYVAVFGSGRVLRLDETGNITDGIKMPGKLVTNCALGGRDRKTLYVTEMETSSLYALPVTVPGLALFPFSGAYRFDVSAR